MKKKKALVSSTIFIACSLMLHLMVSVAISNEDALTNEVNIHQKANKCINTPCETQECLDQCALLCDSCHGPPINNLNLSRPTGWNPNGQTLSEIYPDLTRESFSDISDVCNECHGKKTIHLDNHPVDIHYYSTSLYTGEANLVEEPQGPLLVCENKDDKGSCIVRCVSCHKVHPSEKEGEQIAGLLRVNNFASALCISCHEV